jgi:hypothetical protein
MVYLARKDGGVVHHTSLEAMRVIDGIDAPETTVSEAEFEAAGGLARIINGELVIGKTPEEAAAERAERRALEIDAELRGLDAKSARPARAVARAIAGGTPPNPADAAKLDEYETRADALRSEKNGLLTGVAG